jgi:hypothetical protein
VVRLLTRVSFLTAGFTHRVKEHGKSESQRKRRESTWAKTGTERQRALWIGGLEFLRANWDRFLALEPFWFLRLGTLAPFWFFVKLKGPLTAGAAQISHSGKSVQHFFSLFRFSEGSTTLTDVFSTNGQIAFFQIWFWRSPCSDGIEIMQSKDKGCIWGHLSYSFFLHFSPWPNVASTILSKYPLLCPVFAVSLRFLQLVFGQVIEDLFRR